MATPDRQERIDAARTAAPVANDPFFGATRGDVTVNGKTYKDAINIGTAKPPAATEVGMVSPISGLKITGTERNMSKERQAMDIGYTKEYIASRGGINSQGYFNDTPLSGQLTAEEQRKVTKPDGSVDTAAMARILQEKQIAELVAQGLSKEEAASRVSSQFGVYGIGGGKAGTVGGAGGTAGAGTLSSSMVGTGGPGTPEQQAARKSAYDLLYQQFSNYGLGSLVEEIKGLITENVSPSEFTIRLRESKPYQVRFAANKARIGKGLLPLSEAEYLENEDKYQMIMRSYGLPEAYYSQTVDPVTGIKVQSGFEKLIAGDVSPAELEDRVQVAYNRVINAAPEIAASLRSYYPDITNGDIIAYALDPEKALNNIRRKVTAAEIGAGAAMAGLATDVARAEELQRYGVTGETARQGFQTVAEVAPRGGQLAAFYKETPYTQTTAEQEVFGLTGATEAAKQRKKLTSLEQASFAGQSGVAGGALARDRAGAF